MASLVRVSWLVLSVYSAYALHVENLNGLSFESVIFKPHYVSKYGNHSKHDIHVIDKFGKYLRLSYEAIHPSNINILKLDDTIHRSNIESLSCYNDDHNSIKVQFKTQLAALQYYHKIHSSLFTSSKYFITASHNWGCINPHKQRYESIIRQIQSIGINTTDHKQLILTTKHGDITDIFQELHLKLTTNIGQEPKQFTRTKSYSHQYARRTLSFGGAIKELWHKITDSIKALRDDIAAVITEVRAISGDIITYEKGEPVDYKNVSHYTWSWNADDTQAFYIENALSCDHCYAKFDLEYKYEVHIEDKQVKYLYLAAQGPFDIFVGIQAMGSIVKEWRINTPQIPVPYLSIGVVGVVFGVYVNGQFAVGASLGINAFSYTTHASGYIKKGVVYNNYDDTSTDYINEQDVTYAHHGPKMKFVSANIRLYSRASINLGLSFIGELAFGLQPDFTLNFEKQDASSDCALYCTPSVGLAVFVRADIELIKRWHNYKTWPMNVIQTNISNWGGCLSHVDVTQIQTKQEEVQDVIDANEHENRRRLFDILNASEIMNAAVTYIDFSLAKQTQYTEVESWGRVGSFWWSNMSTLEYICNEYEMTCFEYKHLPILKPNHANLMISVDAHALIALYQTQIQIAPKSQWAQATNITFYTNISCIARHKLVYDRDASMKHHISTYNAHLLEWFCDTDIEQIYDMKSYEAWICMISLPPQLHAIQLGFEFRDIMLFDKTWCKVFQLTKKNAYVMDDMDLNTFQYPSKLWYGVLDCYNETTSVELYFIRYSNHSVDALLSVEYKNASKDTLYAEGSIDFVNMVMELHVMHWYEKNASFQEGEFMFIGLLNVLHDGTMTFYGSVSHSECIGFIFQGFLNLTQFDDKVYTSSIDKRALVPQPDEDIHSEKMSNIALKVCVIMAIAFMFIVFVWMIYQCINAKKGPITNVNYQLMNDENL